MKRTWAAAAGSLLVLACAQPAEPPAPRTGRADAALAPPADPRVIHRSHRAMGTQVTLTAYTADEAHAVDAFAAAFRELERLEALLTVWRDDSEVSRINAAAGGAPVVVSSETFTVLTRAVELAALTRGKFDPTFGALAGLWRFDHDQDDRIPPAAAVKAKLPLVDYRRIELDAERRTVRLAKKGMRLHLGGIGKGYAVDRAVELLRARGLTDFMVQFGGDMYVAGTRGDRPWRVGVRDPRGGPSSYFAAAEVTDATFSTSGDYERFFIHEGRRYHHILDPATGRPADAARSVTVMAKDAMTADALSTGLFILGPAAGLPIVDAVEGAGAIFVDRDNRVHVSSRLEGAVKLLAAPTP